MQTQNVPFKYIMKEITFLQVQMFPEPISLKKISLIPKIHYFSETFNSQHQVLLRSV